MPDDVRALQRGWLAAGAGLALAAIAIGMWVGVRAEAPLAEAHRPSVFLGHAVLNAVLCVLGIARRASRRIPPGAPPEEALYRLHRIGVRALQPVVLAGALALWAFWATGEAIHLAFLIPVAAFLVGFAPTGARVRRWLGEPLA